MFWSRFYDLCVTSGTKPLPVVVSIGVASGSITKWKNGTIPNGDTLLKIAAYFDVSVDYLLGRTDIKSMASASVPDVADTQLLEGFHRLNEIGKKRALDSLNDLVQLPRYTEKLYKIKKAVRGGEFTEEYINEEEKNRLFNGTPINDDML